MTEQPKPMQVALIEWRALRKNSLLGFASVRLGAMKIRDVSLHASNGKRWANLPSKPIVSSDGTVKRDDGGKMQYVPIIEWASRDTADRFSEAVIAAVEREHPGATAA